MLSSFLLSLVGRVRLAQSRAGLSRLIVLLTLGSLFAVGCGGVPSAGGDPGGLRLSMLSNDAVFAALPAGARQIEIEHRKAHYREPGFSGGGWAGPTVVITFRASAPADVYRFYAQEANAAGWRPTAKGAFGVTDRWAKTYPGGESATLILAPIRQAPADYVYRLAGGIAPQP